MNTFAFIFGLEIGILLKYVEDHSSQDINKHQVSVQYSEQADHELDSAAMLELCPT